MPMKKLLPAVLLSAACAAPGLTPRDRDEIRAFQEAVRRETARPESELFEDRLLLELPAARELHHLDVQGRTGTGTDDIAGGWESFVLCVGDGGQTRVLWEGSIGLPSATDGEFSRYCGENDDGEFFACAGCALTGYTKIHWIRLSSGEPGPVFVAEKRGTQVLAVGDHVREGWFFDSRFPPVLSEDGSRIAYVVTGMFDRYAVIAPTADPIAAVRLEHPGKLDWPVELSHDGRRWTAAGTDGDGAFVVENGEVVDRFAKVGNACRPEHGDLVAWRVERDGKEHYLVGRTLGPAFDQVYSLQFSADGRKYMYVGSDASGRSIVVDGTVVATLPGKGFAGFTERGNTWVATIQGPDGDRVRIGARELGPFPRIQYVCAGPDGSSIAFQLESGGWFVDGNRIGEGWKRVEEVQLPAGGGFVFEGKADDGQYLVTSAARSGPWEWVGNRRVSADGRRIAFVAGRGREVWRKVVDVRQ
jgi:hypothetical protein